MATSQFNAIAIVDAIPEGEFNTAIRLKESLRDISDYVAEGLEVRHIRATTKKSLADGLETLHTEVRTSGLKPWLHLEGHGYKDEQGFQLAEGARCTWAEFIQLITPINVTLELNLMLVLAACYGGSFAGSMQTTERAPVLGLIGPRKEVTVSNIEDGFHAFYRTFFDTASLKNAIEALNKSVQEGTYYRTTAERFFYEVWASYKTVQCSAKEIENRVRIMYREAKRPICLRLPVLGN